MTITVTHRIGGVNQDDEWEDCTYSLREGAVLIFGENEPNPSVIYAPGIWLRIDVGD